MLLSYLLKVLSPVPVEADLFLAQLVKPLRVALDGDLKARLVLIVVLIARLHNLLVMVSVLDINIT